MILSYIYFVQMSKCPFPLMFENIPLSKCVVSTLAAHLVRHLNWSVFIAPVSGAASMGVQASLWDIDLEAFQCKLSVVYLGPALIYF